jgi:guanylate kinase
MIVILVGESASGKSTLAANLQEFEGFSRIVTYTTRPPRDGEQDGIDYHFVTDEKFNEMIANNEFVEHANYRGWQYGTAINSKITEDIVVVLTPAGARAFRKFAAEHPELELDIFVIYLMVDRRSRLVKLLERGDDIEEAYRRSLSDVGQFDAFDREADCIMHNEEYCLSSDDVYALVANEIKRKKNEQNI